MTTTYAEWRQANRTDVLLPMVGTRVRYRFWDNQPWHTGVISAYAFGSISGNVCAEISRDGYRETASLPVRKVMSADTLEVVR